jgi:hypothetical protein
MPAQINGVANSANILAACKSVGLQTPCDYGAFPRPVKCSEIQCHNLMLQAVGPIQIASTLEHFSSLTTLIILIFKMGCSATSTSMMLMPTEAGLFKIGQVPTGGPTLVTSMVKLCALRKKVLLRLNAPRSLETCTLTAVFGEATVSSVMTTALALLTHVRAGLLPTTMVVSGFK